MGYRSATEDQNHSYQRSWSGHFEEQHTSETIGDTMVQAFGYVDNDKTMEKSHATAATQISQPSHVGLGDHRLEEEDDTTTIRSIDSASARGILNVTEDDGDYSNRLAGEQTALGTASNTAGEMTSTCSVSTAPSTDEASLAGDWANISFDSAASRLKPYQQSNHSRVPSWESSPRNPFSSSPASPGAMHLPPSYSPQWSGANQQQQLRMASFRGDQQQGFPPSGRTNSWSHQHHTPSRYANPTDPSLPFLPPGRGAEAPRGIYHRQQNNMGYSMQQQHRKPYAQPPLPPTNTPPRGGFDRSGRSNQRVSSAGQSPHRPQGQGQGQQGSGARSSSEVLKTLLRKKACLYEPDTSRAVALVTWLVGRELALEYGFFSRQQLQAGVHACVANKIDSGIITRTKVNRCMQIILNSCFHYIIPRPDGTEENGDVFRHAFANEMKDDSFLLSVLPVPWNDVVVDRGSILSVCSEETNTKNGGKSSFETPASSPRLGSTPADKLSPGKESVDDNSDSKRAVLLCFNENVRRAEDVFRCHNEFIRDTAHSCNLQMSSDEWRLFFGREASSSPYLWGNVGIPVPFLENQSSAQTDALGLWTQEEANVLRTSWCSKRYEHNHELCGFAHAEVNGGWLRRNPVLHVYNDTMCSNVSVVNISSREVVIVNACSQGVDCGFAHSAEEIAYHPHRYKQRTCGSMGRQGGCSVGDMCPNFHPADSYHFPKKTDGRSPRHPRHGYHQGHKHPSNSTACPSGSPIVYVGASPISSFERQLALPGLRDLFRRQSANMYSELLGNANEHRTGKQRCYDCFVIDGTVTTQQERQTTGKTKAIGPAAKLE